MSKLKTPHNLRTPHSPHTPRTPQRPTAPFYSNTPFGDGDDYCVSPIEFIQEIRPDDFSSLNLSLKKITELPDDLNGEELEQLTNYMNTHSDISTISYYELFDRIEPRSPKRRCLNNLNKL